MMRKMMGFCGSIVLFSFLAGCVGMPAEITTIAPVDTTKPKVGKIITVGTFMDNRFPFWPRKEANSPLQKDKEEQMIKDFEPISVIKEIRIPMGEVRSHLSHALKMSTRFEEIINPPSVSGEPLQEILKKSLETSDYVIVGEVNSFHVKDMGPNKKAAITLPLDVTLLAFPNLFVVLLTGGRSLLLSGGLFAVYNAECVLSLSITVYSVESGNPIATTRVESRARCPVDAISIFGNLHNEEDDWVDLGRRLGDIALINACNQAVDEVAKIIQQKEGKKGKK